MFRSVLDRSQVDAEEAFGILKVSDDSGSTIELSSIERYTIGMIVGADVYRRLNLIWYLGFSRKIPHLFRSNI